MKWKFEPSDFEAALEFGSRNAAARIANAKLAEWKRDAMVVYGNSYSGWHEKQNIHSITRALLIDIEELRQEPCKHEPGMTHSLDSYPSHETTYCKHCGVKLKATWSPS